MNAFTHRREWLARSAAAWKTVSFSVRTDFMPIRRGGRVLYLRPELAGTASAILVQIAQLDRESRTGAGIRCGGFVITVDERTTLFLRRSRRGGSAPRPCARSTPNGSGAASCGGDAFRR